MRPYENPDLLIDEGEIKMARHRLAQEKMALQSELSDINASCATRIPCKEYQKKQTRRAQIVRQLQEKDHEISALNIKRTEVRTRIDVEKSATPQIDVRELVAIRDKWHAFSMEPHNPKPAREVAWKISQEIRTMLKRYFDHES